MKAIVIFLGLLALSQAAPSLNTWELFKAVHKKAYTSEAEESLRQKIFNQNVDMIEEHNQKYEAGKETFKMGINRFADMLQSEIGALMKGFRSTDKVPATSVFVADKNAALPDTVDWREEGIVTPVKDQGDCGSCWAFSTTGTLEGQHALSTGSLVSLSEEQLVDCAPFPNQGCDGGFPKYALNYIRNNGGIMSEEDYPYLSTDTQEITGPCEFVARKVVATCTGYVAVKSSDENGDELALKEAVADIGPISVSIDASHLSFQFYKSGVYYNENCSSELLDHAVLAVGYGTTITGQDYWLVKNSWNAGWGDEGYIKMARNRDNNCGIATEPVYATV